MNDNTIPKGQAAVGNLALLAIPGALAAGAAIGLEHNTAPLIAADYYDYAGNPATPEVPGKQELLNTALLTIKTTQVAAQAALKSGRQFCQASIALLRPVLGHRWNGAWNAAGFTAGNLRVPSLPLALLVQVRAYFEANPAKESGEYTAANAQAQVVAIQNALQARNTAKGARWSVKAARDAAFKQLRKRLSGLRAELAQLLSPEDDRWYAFGFRRPADGKIPVRVSTLTLVPGAAGRVLATWPAASYAENYRVEWSVLNVSGDPTVAGLTSATQFALTGLPSGATVVVGVIARNNSGETAATQAQIVVP
jgi:hypothetical protein